jgi:hypothetical protein
MKELIAKLNALKIVENDGLPYDLPQEVVDKYPGLKDTIAEGIDPDEHRWYVLTTSVYEVSGAYIGVRVVETIKSESMGRKDVHNILNFFPMKKVMVESFEAIKEPASA